MTDEEEYLYSDETHQIIRCAMNVANYFGTGFLESVYHKALEEEFRENNIPFSSQKQIPVYYKGKDIHANFYADLIVDDKIIIELKSKERLINADEAQILNYLKATGIRLGLLINFGNKRRLEWKRFIR
ncbi:MAG TPA: GxxExxY protein [Methanocorpusculum sp.]|nr:GxxExxY protein [Methanocorpusculum sp.]HJJ72218.1 GxxExxY protein [Methanocorpusculum sp.]HJJ76686.1 GxxExxY protein [Methanocorpusculum sp.]